MDVISNNLANSAVIGFKKNRISFQQMLDQAGNTVDKINNESGTPDPLLISMSTDLSQGDIRSTGSNLDIAIFGKGFLKINTPNGIRYTRKGNFDLDPQGNLITQEGNMVMGRGGPIILSGNKISIDAQGSIATDGVVSGQLDIVDFENYEGLIKEGKGLFRNSLEEPEIDFPPDTVIKQRYLELSNVNVAEEMVNMIHSIRAFESYQKAIKMIDDLDNKAINQVGRLR